MLRLLADQKAPMGVTAIARALELGPSSCFNILRTLAGEGFVSFDPTEKTYELGGGAIALAHRALDPESTFETARPFLSALAYQFGATCALWRIVEGRRLLLVGSETSGEPARIQLAAGQRLPLLVGAAGRSLVAQLDITDASLRSAFAQVRWATPLTFETYQQQLAEVRERGYALDDGAYMRGVTSVAAVVRQPPGKARLSISTMFFAGAPPGQLESAGLATVRTAREIALRLGATS